MSIYIDEIRKDYHEDKIVPFIGAGLSIPFNVPSWGEMIKGMSIKYSKEKKFIKEVVEHDLNSNDYWSAVDSIKKFAGIGEQDIKEEVSKLIRERQKLPINNTKHNYLDLSKLN